MLALSYEHGLGTKQNYVEAERFYVAAAESGNETAKGSLDLIRKNKNKLGTAKSEFVNNTVSEEFISFKEDNKYGLKDRSGKIIVPPKYDNFEPIKFAEGLARVQLNGKWGFINQAGKEVIPPKYDQTGNFQNGVATVKSGEAWGVVDKTGRELVPPKYFEIHVMKEGLMAVNIGGTTKGLFTEGGKWGFIDKTGKEVIPLQYNDVGSFSEGLAAVKLSDKWGFIDKNGIVIIPLEYTTKFNIGNVTPVFKNGLAEVVKDGRIVAIDKAGRIVGDLGE